MQSFRKIKEPFCGSEGEREVGREGGREVGRKVGRSLIINLASVYVT